MPDEVLPTKERLARALEALNDPRLATTILNARRGHYDDYESDIATPTTALVNDLRRLGRPEMAQRAIDGEWDGTRAEGEAWFQREGRHLFGGKTGAPPPKPGL